MRIRLNKAPKTIWTNPIHFLAFGFGSGVMPILPGTFGTLVAIPFYFAMQDLPLLAYAIVVLIAAILGVWVCGVAARDSGVPDHSGIVWDEIVGYWLTMLAAPKGWLWIVIGFFLFRIFDMVKPWPIRWFDCHVKGGFGIMLDDWLAALYAWLVMHGIVWLKLIEYVKS